MKKHQALWLAVVLLMIASLMAVPVATGAQASLSNNFTWEPYSLAIDYPGDWTIAESSSRVSLHPTDRNVSAGSGPELVLFAVTNTTASQLESAVENYAASVVGTTDPITTENITGYQGRSFTFSQNAPAAVGKVTLFAVDDNTVLGIAYITPASESTAFLPVLRTMQASLHFIAADTPASDQGTLFGNNLTEYTNVEVGYSFSYPTSWAITAEEASGDIRIAPAGVDISENHGPAFVVLMMRDLGSADIDTVLSSVISRQPGVFSPAQMGALDGQSTRFVTYTNNHADMPLSGAVYLIDLSNGTMLATGYFAPSAEFDQWEAAFESIRASLHLGSNGIVAESNGTVSLSTSTASIQLPQMIPWSATGLTFSFPANWRIDDSDLPDSIEGRASQPANDSTALRSIGVLQTENTDSATARGFLQKLLDSERISASISDLQVTGYDAAAVDFTQTEDDGTVVAMRAILIDVTERNTLVMVLFTTMEEDWEAFHPLMGAFTSSIRLISDTTVRQAPATAASGDGIQLVAAHKPDAAPIPRQGDPVIYTWVEMGITFELPPNWGGYGSTQDYDMALASPEAAQGSAGAYLTFKSIPYLNGSLTDALQPITEQMGGEVEAFSAAGLDGTAVITSDEANGSQFFVLLPYSDNGETLYIQATVPAGQDTNLPQTILNSMVIEQPHADADAINAAWQASLQENGTLAYGSPDAPVRVTEYLSFTCGHCANYTRDIERLIALDVEDASRIQFELAPVMWDEHATRASHALYCATEQGQGYSAYKALYQGYFEQGYDVAYSDDGIQQIMSTLELSMDVFNLCYEEKAYSSTIDAISTRFRDGGMTGTPTLAFGINGEEPAPIIFPDGEIWSGRIPLGTVRDILGKIIDEGIALDALFG